MLSRSFFPNFSQGPFPKIAWKGPGFKFDQYDTESEKNYLEHCI